MRKLLLVAGIGILLLPPLFVVWLFVAAHWPRMDPVTTHAPVRVRKAVVSVAMRNPPRLYSHASKPFLSRIVKLDPENGPAWERRCLDSVVTAPKIALESCENAVRLQNDADSYRGLAGAQEFSGDFCAAEASYEAGANLKPEQLLSFFFEGMGRNAFLCGNVAASRKGYEAALQAKQNDVNSRADRDLNVVDRTEFSRIQQPLIAIYERLGENRLAAQLCRQAHPDWKVCHCTIDAKGGSSCSNH